MKKVLATILCVALLSMTFVAEAQVSVDNGIINNNSTSNEEEHIYYSDLFYAYSFYLSSQGLYDNNMAAQSAMNVAFDEYLSSSNFILSNISEHINLTTNIPQLLKDYSDLIAGTEFRYNDSLDAANLKFIAELLSEKKNTKIENIESIGKDTKEYNQITKILKVGSKSYEELNKVIKTLPEIKYYSESDWNIYQEPFDLMINELKPSSVALSSKVPSLKSGFSAFSTVLKKCGEAKDIYDLFYAFIISVCMEDMRMSLIEDIISTQATDSVLYEGMTRLKAQLSEGWVSYFLRTYFEDKMIEQVADFVSKSLTTAMMENAGALYTALQNPGTYFEAQNLFSNSVTHIGAMYAILSATISIINTAVFDWILDVPSPKDYQVTMILAQYSNGLYEGLVAKRDVFQRQFDTSEIEKYETLFSAYTASINCALDACGDLESSLFSLSSDTRKKLNSATDLFESETLYSDYVDSIIATIASTPVSERTITDFGTWSVSNGTTLTASSDEIVDGYIYCPAIGLKANIIQEKGTRIYFANNKELVIDGDLSIYVYSGTAGVINQGTKVIVNGDFLYDKWAGTGYSGTSSSFYNNGVLEIHGNARINGSYSYFFGGNKAANFTNQGTFDVKGNLLFMEMSGVFTNTGLVKCGKEFAVLNKGIIQNKNTIETKDLRIISSYQEPTPYQYSFLNMESGSVLKVSGNYTMMGERDSQASGLTVFNGINQQVVKGLKAFNVDVQNENGIKYESDTYVYGAYKLDGHPLDNNGYYSYIYDGVSFDSISDYKEVYVYDTSVELCSSFKGNIRIGYKGTVLVPSNQHVRIDGNLKCINTSKSDAPSINNRGHLEVTGDIELYDTVEEKGYGYIHQNDAGAILAVGGDLQFKTESYSDITNGTVVFNGMEEQNIRQLRAKNIDVQNRAGIEYDSDIYVYGCYRLNGNPLKNNDHYSYIYNGVSFDQISDYKKLYVNNTSVTLSSSFKGDLDVGYKGHLSIPSSASVIIDGNVQTGFQSTIRNYGSLQITGGLNNYYPASSDCPHVYNYNKLFVDGSINNANGSYYGYIHQNDAGAILAVGGDLQFNSNSYSDITNGTVIFNGTEQQTVTRLKTPIIILENESEGGVVFTTSISPSVLFDHKGNHFTLYNNGSGSTFVDYDGDGLKDNVDPYPTVGTPCLITVRSEDVARGTVSQDAIDTIGGTTVTVVAEPTQKYTFKGWQNAAGTIVSDSSTYTFAAKGDEVLTALFEKRSRSIVIKSVEGGSILAPDRAEIDSLVNVEIIAEDGYVYEEGSLLWNGRPIDNFQFIMPDEAVVLTAKFVSMDEPVYESGMTVLYETNETWTLTGDNLVQTIGDYQEDGGHEYYYDVGDDGFNAAFRNDVATYGMGASYLVEMTFSTSDASTGFALTFCDGTGRIYYNEALPTLQNIPTITATFKVDRLPENINEAFLALYNCDYFAPTDEYATITITHLKLTVLEDRAPIVEVSPATAALSLQGKVGVNFYVDVAQFLPQGVGNAYVELTYNHNTETYSTNRTTDTILVRDAEQAADGTYKFAITAVPAQICDEIDIALYDEEGTLLWSREGYTIKEYCDYQIENSRDSRLVELCKSIVNYGVATQVYFDYNTANLATAGGDYGALDTAPTINANRSISNNATGLKLNSATLMVQTDTAVRIYYTLEKGVSLDNYTCTLVKPTISNMKWRFGASGDRNFIEVFGIESTNLAHDFTLKIVNKNDESIASLNYSVFCFLKPCVLDENADVKLRNLCRAIYAYAVAADRFFNVDSWEAPYEETF